MWSSKQSVGVFAQKLDNTSWFSFLCVVFVVCPSKQCKIDQKLLKSLAGAQRGKSDKRGCCVSKGPCPGSAGASFSRARRSCACDACTHAVRRPLFQEAKEAATDMTACVVMTITTVTSICLVAPLFTCCIHVAWLKAS